MKRQTEHRLGMSEANRVVRRLKLDTGSTRNIAAAAREIDGLCGIDQVAVEKGGAVICLAYDASRLSIDGIEKILEKYGVELSHDWWTRFKEDHYRFVDQNVKDNAAHVPTCCNKIPPGAGRK